MLSTLPFFKCERCKEEEAVLVVVVAVAVGALLVVALAEAQDEDEALAKAKGEDVVVAAVDAASQMLRTLQLHVLHFWHLFVHRDLSKGHRANSALCHSLALHRSLLLSFAFFLPVPSSIPHPMHSAIDPSTIDLRVPFRVLTPLELKELKEALLNVVAAALIQQPRMSITDPTIQRITRLVKAIAYYGQFIPVRLAPMPPLSLISPDFQSLY